MCGLPPGQNPSSVHPNTLLGAGTQAYATTTMQWSGYGGYGGNGNGQQQPQQPATASRKWGPVGQRLRYVENNVSYVGEAVDVIESTGGELLRLEYSNGQRPDILRVDLERTRDALTLPPHTVTRSALRDDNPPQTPEYPGTARRTRARPYLNKG
ncbi:hypothetical protein BD310DRAFT_910984 [Dichomitus squalens]|uniref:Uncharacterized protein n=1 Tax=Dichomitus squalens TaxID=114155 RepID=A0A4Q9QDE8_9APHY|nr:hypothetical protein BD310DRAFT_910984 [Dichomitus squalens]